MFVKRCGKHGNLTIGQVNKSGNKGYQQYKCKQCQKELHRANYLKNKDKILAKQKEYKFSDLENYKEIKSKSFKKNAHKYRDRRNNDRKKRYYLNHKNELEKLRIRKTFARQNLSRSYLAYLLKRKLGLSSKNQPNELIDIQKVLILIHRIKKKINKEDKNDN